MLTMIFRSIFGTKHERDAKRMRPAVEAINALEPAMQALSDVELRGMTDELRKRLADAGELEALLPEAFAACREAARRTVRMRHFDVQLMGGMVLHEGKIAEMATGEGKTLVATLPAYLNALPGLGTHVVTVNDYLARRDAQWMGPIYHALGLSVGVIQHEMQYLYDPLVRLAGHPTRLAPPVHAPRGVPRGHHLRHEQRVRVRLPPRQYALQPRRDGPAPAPLRDRRRGRLDPDRRGAHPADHLRTGSERGKPRADVREGQPDHPEAHPGGDHRRRQALRDRGAIRG